ncbi:group II intron reverse transcriptase/maturase [uncultured Tateyamaria sp.]|uniref:group II intron reverse transcriptase/maturase n=1 Tax=uncultured Tateyamaria sp. TaxID=455651 RepID=UPI0026383D21|nr:group II intron reverse transcriptase/maturase [uncultured Tateyamaria sp.]
MPGMVNTSFILDMQPKLYRWSASDKGKTFSDLFNLICDRRTLIEAWIRLSRNRGSQTPGTDGMTRRRIEEQVGGVGRFLDEVHDELKSGNYRPEPVRQRLIPKTGKPGQFRPLGIPTLKDRLVQMAMKFVLEPIFEADFYPNSYGFRRGRSTHDALAAVQKQLHPTTHGPSLTHYVIEGDIKGCFDAINHHLLMEEVKRRIQDRKVLLLIRAFLKAGIMIEGSLEHSATGTPQGGVLSPLLANIFLHRLDERYDRWMPRPRENPTNAVGRRRFDRRHGKSTFYMVRYADDFVLLVVGSRQQAEAEREALAQFLWDEMRLELSAEKTLITRPEEGFIFLGYRVVRTRSYRNGNWVGNLRIPKEKVKALRREIKKRTSRATLAMPFKDLIWSLNPLISGWRNYFQYATGASDEFQSLDNWLWHRIDRWLQKKHRKTGARKLRAKFRAGSHPPMRNRWRDGKAISKQFLDGGTRRYRNRGVRIPNGWNENELGEDPAMQGAPQFWRAHHALETMQPTGG